jgi:hypothetical protein
VIAWSERPVEVANLLNPPFMGLLLRQAVDGYLAEKGEGMPYSITFLILPILLHQRTRAALPRAITTPMHAWLQQYPQVRIGFADRARELLPYTKEALMFAMQLGVLAIDQDGHVVPGSKRTRNPGWGRESGMDDFRTKPTFVGRWLAHAGSAATVFTMWGVRP